MGTPELTVAISEVDDDTWTASCTCGWTSEDWESFGDAQLDGWEHWDAEHWEMP